MQYVNENNEIVTREITAIDHINKSLAEQCLKHFQEHPPDYEEMSESEEWDDPEGITYMDSRPEDQEDNHIYLKYEENNEDEKQEQNE